MIVSGLVTLWEALSNFLCNAWVICMMVGFWVVTPFMLLSMAVIAYIYYKVYKALISWPWQILRTIYNCVSQFADETCNLLLHKPGLVELEAFVQKPTWFLLESRMADYVAITLICAHTALRDQTKRVLGWLADTIITGMFHMPHGLWISLGTQFVASFMLGGGGTVYMFYAYLCSAFNETFGHDFLHAQQAKLEASQGVYLPLAPGHIRVLRIHAGQFGSPLSCELRTVEFSAARYEALSYVWGNSTMDRKIQVNGESLWVTRNLYYALTYLRDRLDARELWVDALCINQKDLGERAVQVSHMRRIYGSAERVVVWLGVTPFGLKQTFRVARRGESPDYHYGSVRVVSRLLTSAWWVRVWIVQELVLAKTAVIQCGHDLLDWDRFCLLVDLVARSPCFSPSGTYVEEYRSLKHGRLSMFPGADHLSQKKDLAGRLYAFRANRATDSRDKVFAFLGLSEGLGEGTQQDSSAALIRVDYTAEPEDVFRDCAVKLINASGSLAMVALAECVEKKYFRGELATRSTWFPRWSSSGNRFRAVPFWTGLRRGDSDQQPWMDLPFSAAGGLPAPPCEVVGRAIRLSGWVADEVAAVGQRTDISMPDFLDLLETNQSTKLASFLELLVVARNWKSVLPRWKSMATGHHRYSSNDRDAKRAFYKAITAGKSSDRCHNEPTKHNLMNIIEAACYGRTFFVTACGRFGLGPSSIAVGDKVTILLGCDVPIILRRVSNYDHQGDQNGPNTRSFHLNIGQAYIDEYMVYPRDLKNMIEEGKQPIDQIYLG